MSSPAESSQPAIAELLPHRGRALLLDQVVAWGPGQIVCSARLRDDHPYMLEGRVAAVVALELMAQAVAALAGLLGRERGEPPRIGYLVGARQLDLHVGAFEAGQALRVIAAPARVEARAGTYECRVEGDEGVLATASLTVYEPDEAPRA